MRRVTSGNEPAVLAAFRAANPAACWPEFKNEPGNKEVFDSLAAAQGYLCAYCEIDISGQLRGSIEHYEPKSASTPARNLHLEFSNLLACCEGGSRPELLERSQKPLPASIHCGALKGERPPGGRVLNPRAIPLAPLIWRVTTQGKLEANREACLAARVDPELAESTIDELGLNRVVLRRLRSAVFQDLDKELGSVDEDAMHSRMLAIASDQLIPDGRGRLQPFWSTIRAWAQPSIEEFVANNPPRIPGMA